MTFVEAMEHIAQGFEIIGAALLVLGLVFAAWVAIRTWLRTRDGRVAYMTLRRSIGGVLLLGIEVLVAADLVHTVAVEPTLTNVGILAMIVIIRTVLSFSLEIEIEGVAPWRRAALTARRHNDETSAAPRP